MSRPDDHTVPAPDVTERPARLVGWHEASRWTGEEVRRDVFYFPSEQDLLYGSLYTATEARRSVGLVVCSSWGIEADRSQGLAHRLALGMAQMGGVALTFHYRGYGDSPGDVSSVTLEQLATSAAAAAAEITRRYPGHEVVLAGLMLGSAVAALAGEQTGASRLLLVQPCLDPASYFEGLGQHGRRSRLQATSADAYAFGHPVPESLRRERSSVEAVGAAASSFKGRGAVVRYRQPDAVPDVLGGLEERIVPGAWSFGARSYPELLEGSLDWLGGAAVAPLAGPVAEQTDQIVDPAGDTASIIRHFIDEVVLDEAVQSHDALAEKLVGSLALAQVMDYIQEQFGIDFEDGELVAENFSSIPRLAATIDARRASGQDEGRVGREDAF